MNVPSEVRKYVLVHGHKYLPGYTPPIMTRGDVGDCFDTVLINVLNNQEELRYVEGYAKHPYLDTWVHHAWCTNREGVMAFDPTWGVQLKSGGNKTIYPIQTEYIGFEIPIGRLIEFILDTEYKAILANASRNVTLAGNALPPNFPMKYYGDKR